jgi:2-haloacid dehalogenase
VHSLTGRDSPLGHHQDFWICTTEALRYVATRFGLRDAALMQDLLDADRRLDAYAEVPAMLRALRETGTRTAILSNGSPMMLVEATTAAGISTLLDALLSVEAVGIFKPDRRVYALAEQRLGLPASRMMFVSANPWDTQAALAAGFRAIRINRTKAPDEYGLEAAGVPSLTDLSPLPGLIS